MFLMGKSMYSQSPKFCSQSPILGILGDNMCWHFSTGSLTNFHVQYTTTTELATGRSEGSIAVRRKAPGPLE